MARPWHVRCLIAAATILLGALPATLLSLYGLLALSAAVYELLWLHRDVAFASLVIVMSFGGLYGCWALWHAALKPCCRSTLVGLGVGVVAVLLASYTLYNLSLPPPDAWFLLGSPVLVAGGHLAVAARQTGRAAAMLLALSVVAHDGCLQAAETGCMLPSKAPAARWYKGNTHAHVISLLRGLLPHGDSGAVTVAKWYRNHGYQFLAITDHNRLVDPHSARLQALQGPNFLLIPGVEITSDYMLWGSDQHGARSIHTTALGVKKVPAWSFGDVPVREIVASHLERARAAGGIPIVNHVNYRHQLRPQDLIGLPGLGLFEVYNAHPVAHNDGGPGWPSTDQFWDAMLSAGMRVYGVAADDAHHFKFTAITTHMRKTFALPGAAWVMVRAPKLGEQQILDALVAGRFYATTGVILAAERHDPEQYAVAVDATATRTALADPFVAEGSHLAPPGAEEGVRIEFIGYGGKRLAVTHSTCATLKLEPSYGYVRVRITWIERLRTRIDKAPVLREFRAWTQPEFLR